MPSRCFECDPIAWLLRAMGNSCADHVEGYESEPFDSACANSTSGHPGHGGDARERAERAALYAYSTLDGLLAGVYDGELTIAQLHSKGDFGLGTFNRLDGEMVLLDGVCYHVRADGTVSVARPQDKSPLSYVTHFHHAKAIRPDGPLPLPELEKWLDTHLQNKNLFYAIRVDGHFRDISVRAIAAQSKPYKPLSEIVGTQMVRNYHETHGVLVGFRSPAYSRGISVPGYHWHFLTDDRKHGGHVLKFTLVNAGVQFNELAGLDLQLPRTNAFANSDQTKDRTAEIKLVEGE